MSNPLTPIGQFHPKHLAPSDPSLNMRFALVSKRGTTLFSHLYVGKIPYQAMIHSGIIFHIGYDSGHIGNPFSPLFHPHRSEYPAPFLLMWPRINNQKIVDPVWLWYYPLVCITCFDVLKEARKISSCGQKSIKQQLLDTKYHGGATPWAWLLKTSQKFHAVANWEKSFTVKYGSYNIDLKIWRNFYF